MNPEGKFLDDHTYACILRLNTKLEDTTEYHKKYEEMVQNILDEMGISHEDMNDETEEGYALLEEFNDKVSEQGGALYSEYVKPVALPETYDLHLSISEFTGTKKTRNTGITVILRKSLRICPTKSSRKS